MPGWWAQRRACRTTGQPDDTLPQAEQSLWPPAKLGGRICAGSPLLGGMPAVAGGLSSSFLLKRGVGRSGLSGMVVTFTIHLDSLGIFVSMLLYKSK